MKSFIAHIRTLATAAMLLVLAVAASVTAVAQLPVRSRDVQLISDNNTNYTSLQSVNGQTSNWTLVLPPTAGATGSLITTTVSGSTATASWLTPGTEGQALIITGGVPAWGTPASGWLLLGNAGTNPATNFLGTTDAQPLVIRTNNIERFRINAAGEVGIGTTAVAGYSLHVAGTAGTANVRLGSVSGASITSAFTPTANDGLIVADVNGDLVKRSASSVLNASAWLIGGNTLGAAGDLGTNDAFGLNIRTNGVSRITVSATGDVAVLGTAGTPNLTLTSVSGVAAATVPVGFDRALIANNTGQVSQASFSAILASGAWTLTGNAGTNPATNFLGTTDNVSLRFRTNNAERMVIDNTGRVGIGGSLTPTDALDVDNGNLRISTSGAGTAGSLRLEEDAANGNNYIGFRAPAALASDRTYTLPSALGTVGQVLVITATGGGNATLDWGTDGTSIFEERPGSNAGIRRRAAYLFGTSPDGLVDIYANDFQGRRTLASQTASGNYSGTFSGQSNTASGTNTVIVGGISNSATNTNGGVLAGSSNTANGTASVIVGGTTNTTNGNNNFIGAGTSNTAGGSDAAIVAGNLNALSNSANNGFIGGGQQNSIGNATSSAILGGESNTIGASAHRSAILGGSNNEISSTNPNSAIWGGQGLTINSARTAGINLNNGAGTASMTVNSLNTIVLGNGDVWLANTNNTASALRFYEPQAATGTFPAAATQYTSFRAGAQTVNIDYTLPTALPVANNHVMVSSTAGIMAWADPAALVGNSFWALGGNAVASAQNLGTTSNFALPIITNNVERMRINATGEVGIGTTAAAGYSLHVGGTAGTPNVRLASVGGAANATAWVPTANDGVITADNNGDLSKRTAQAVVNAGLSTLSGTVNLTAGSTSIVVPNTNVTATSRIVVTYEDASAAGFVATMVTTRVVGASFTVAFSGPIPAGATGRLHYIIVNP